MKRTTWTVEPDEDVRHLMERAILARVGKRNAKNKNATRGLRSKFINDSVRKGFAHLGRKLEAKA